MSELPIRKIPFDFEGVPFQWHPTNPEFAITMNGVSVMAVAFEKFIVDVVREVQPRLTDPDSISEADGFLRQEAQHARVHRQHLRALMVEHPGLEQVRDRAIARFDELVRTRSVEWNLGYIAALEATFTPFFKLVLDHEQDLFAPGDDRVASMFIWHFVEEVEHRSSALILFRDVVGRDLVRLRSVPGIFKHVMSVFAEIVEGFDEAVPLEARGIVARSTLKPKLRDPATPHAYATVPLKAKALSVVGLVRSQSPRHDPEHQPLPRLAERWFRSYDSGVDVTRWYAPAQVG